MAGHILVPIDDSDRSEEAFRYALDTFSNDELTLLHVIDPTEAYVLAGVESGAAMRAAQQRDALEATGERLLEERASEAASEGVDVETVLRTGTVATSIVDYAEEERVDHIVMGSHGRTGASRILLGSVAETVVRRAPVSVTIVR